MGPALLLARHRVHHPLGRRARLGQVRPLHLRDHDRHLPRLPLLHGLLHDARDAAPGRVPRLRRDVAPRAPRRRRPRFRFPKEHSRKPKAFYVDGYDPETGKLAGASARTRGGGGGAAAEREATSKALREITWLLQQGLITPEEAAQQKDAAIRAHTGGEPAAAAARPPEPPKRAASSWFASSRRTRDEVKAAGRSGGAGNRRVAPRLGLRIRAI